MHSKTGVTEALLSEQHTQDQEASLINEFEGKVSSIVHINNVDGGGGRDTRHIGDKRRGEERVTVSNLL